MPKNITKRKVLVKTKEIVILIDKMNLSLAGFARRCKITPSSFSIHLNNNRELSPIVRKKIMTAFRKGYPDIKWDDLFYFEKEVALDKEEWFLRLLSISEFNSNYYSLSTYQK